MLKRLVVLIMGGMLFFACNQNEIKEGPVENLADLQERVGKLNTLTSELDTKRTAIYGLIREFNAVRPETEQFDIAKIDTLLGADQKELLRAMFKEEKDISYNGLLSNILEKNGEIAQLNEQIAKLESQLPKPYTVQTGDTHYEIVLNYLMTQQGIERQQAREIAWKTSMTDNILPGNQVWLLFNEGIVGTYVTQGEAKIAPMRFEQIAKKRMINKAFEEGKAQAQMTSMIPASQNNPQVVQN